MHVFNLFFCLSVPFHLPFHTAHTQDWTTPSNVPLLLVWVWVPKWVQFLQVGPSHQQASGLRAPALPAALPLGLLALLCFSLAVGVSVVHVLWVGTRVWEAFPTLVALVRFLSWVQPRVFDQVMLVFEGLLTDVTLVRTLPCRQRREARQWHTALPTLTLSSTLMVSDKALQVLTPAANLTEAVSVQGPTGSNRNRCGPVPSPTPTHPSKLNPQQQNPPKYAPRTTWTPSSRFTSSRETWGRCQRVQEDAACLYWSVASPTGPGSL